jgi:protein phosphatase
MNNIRTKTLSSKGRRENNQDSYLELKLDPDIIFIAVADGMGGVAGGKKASETVIKCCERIIVERFKEDKTPDLKQVLRKIFYESQKAINEEIKKNPELNGMGTTLTCVLILDDKFVWGNLGDSRIYYYTNSKLNLITKDHTHIQEFIDENKAPLTQSMIDNYGNFLTRSIDGGTDEPDIFPEDSEYKRLKDGEAFLLCSDGLIDNKAQDNTSVLEKYIIGTKDIVEAATKLKDMALENGSTDNITVVLLEKWKIKRKKINFLETKVPLKPAIKYQTPLKRHFSDLSKILGILSSILVVVILFLIGNKINFNNLISPSKGGQDLSYKNDLRKTDTSVNNKKPNLDLKIDEKSEKEILVNKETSLKEIITMVKSKENNIIKDSLVVVPILLNLQLEAAKVILKGRGLQFKILNPTTNKSEIQVTIAKQSPERGNRIKKGSTVELTLKSE